MFLWSALCPFPESLQTRYNGAMPLIVQARQDKRKKFSKRVFEEKLLVGESCKYQYFVTLPRHSGKHSPQNSWEEIGQGIKCELDGGEGKAEVFARPSSDMVAPSSGCII